MTSTLLELAARCEAAAGPDREMDADIALATGWTHRSGADWHKVLEWERPAFTASRDAAAQLLPEGWIVIEIRHVGPNHWYAGLSREESEQVEAESFAPTEAQARTAAALRARDRDAAPRGREAAEAEGQQPGPPKEASHND